MRRRRFLKIVAGQTAALLVGAPRLGAVAGQSRPTRWRGIVLGAEASIEIHDPSPEKARRLLERCVSEIQRLESIFTLYDERSALRTLNRVGTLEAPPPELVELVHKAQAVSEKTAGVFDITIHPVVEATRLHFLAGKPAHNLDLRSALALVDYRGIGATFERITLERPGAAITLNGIAQGFVTDRVAELLGRHGVSHTLVDLGEKRALGPHPDHRPWTLGLVAADNPARLFTTVELESQALASSGGYGTPFDRTGRHHHLIDPRTGQSVNHHRAVHVVAPTATIADALSTALATCLPQETDAILSAFPEARAFFQ